MRLSAILLTCTASFCATFSSAGEGHSLIVERNTFFADSVVTNSDMAAYADGTFPDGATVTLTAVPSTGGTFRKWYGDVPKKDCESPSVTFTMDDDRWIYARFVHQWTLSADKTTMTDGNFTVNVSVHDEAAHTLIVGKPEVNGLVADDDTGSGTIDLGGPIILEGDDTPWTIARFGKYKGSQSIPVARGGTFRYLSPGTIAKGDKVQLFHRGDHKSPVGAYFDMIVLDEPNAPDLTTGYMFNGHEVELTKLILQIPMETELRGTRMLMYMSLSDNRFDWWDFSSVSKIQHSFFVNQWGSNGSLSRRAPLGGKLSLPSLRCLDWLATYTSDDGGAQLFLMPNVEEISLGGATEATTVTNLCTYAFAGNSSLKKLTLHAAPDIYVGKRIFASYKWNTKKESETIDGVEYHIGSQDLSGRTPDIIHFTGQAVSETAISNLLADITAVSTAKKPVAIHASRFQDGWRENRRAWISSPTADEVAAYPGERVIGVYRAGLEAPAGKAVIIHRQNDWDDTSRGMLILFR